MAETLRWWLAIEGIGLVALPLTLVVFRALPGRGYAFAKPLGLLLGGYCFWLALSLHLLPNRPGSIVWAYVPLAAASLYLLRARAPELRQALGERLPLIVATELVFTAALFTAAHLRSFVPEIAGTEKPMDFMMLNAASRSTHYPPEDAWLAGEGVSYYYFGYVLQAMLGKLSAVSTAVAFNLGLAGTAALAATVAFGLGYELARLSRRVTLNLALAAGAAAVVLVTLLGNLEGVLEFGMANDVVSQDIVRRVDIAHLDQAAKSDACLLSGFGLCLEYPNEQSSFWWWWRATRISPDAGSITEFPFFSFLLGDLHPHVMAIPYVLLAAGLGLAFWRSERRPSLGLWLDDPWLLLVSALVVGGLGFLNTWDLPTFGFVIAALVAARALRESPDLVAAARGAAGFLAPLFLLALLLYAPFYLSFASQAGGLEAVTGGATRPLHSALFWTPLLVVNLPLLAHLARQQGAAPRALAGAAALPLALLLAWAALILARGGPDALTGAIGERGFNWLTVVFFAAMLSACILALWRQLKGDDEDRDTLAPVLLVMGTGALLVLGSELFYIDDLFRSRMNTVFKLSYQAWLLLAVSGGFGLAWLAQRLWPEPAEALSLGRSALAATVVLVLAGALLYPLGAALSRTEGLARGGRTLDGIDYLRRDAPDEYAAIAWLARRAGPDERVVEAIGGQYSTAARVSAATGVPAVLGWPGHERQWGRSDEIVRLRQNDVDRAYQTESLEEALSILRKYRVTYVYVGRVERQTQTYPAAGLEKFATGLRSAFEQGQAAIYRVPPQQDSGPEGSGQGRRGPSFAEAAFSLPVRFLPHNPLLGRVSPRAP